jgi:hypothetical protein
MNLAGRPLPSFVALALACVLFGGCASQDVDWSSRIGTYTYADAVKQYGQPTDVEPLPEGGRVGYWVLPDAAAYSIKFQLPEFQSNQGGSSSASSAAMPAGGRHLGTVGNPVLKLTFNPEDKLATATRTKVTAQ